MTDTQNTTAPASLVPEIRPEVWADLEQRYRKLEDTVRRYNPSANFQQIRAAFEFAAKAHGAQMRKDGSPFITHPLAVAQIVAEELHLDSESIEAALLHDTVEDAAERIIDFYGDTYLLHGATPRETALNALARRFGDGIADTVLRLTNPENPAPGEGYFEHLRMWVVSDEHAYVAKASDLVDNAGSLKHMDPSSRRDRLASKYTTPVQLMLAHRDTVTNMGVRKRITDRLEVVAADLRKLAGTNDPSSAQG